MTKFTLCKITTPAHILKPYRHATVYSYSFCYFALETLQNLAEPVTDDAGQHIIVANMKEDDLLAIKLMGMYVDEHVELSQLDRITKDAVHYRHLGNIKFK